MQGQHNLASCEEGPVSLLTSNILTYGEVQPVFLTIHALYLSMLQSIDTFLQPNPIYFYFPPHLLEINFLCP